MRNKREPASPGAAQAASAGESKMWSGRFNSGPSPLMERFSSSLAIDRLMWQEDLAVNRAWARALRRVEILNAAEVKKILQGLQTIAEELCENRFEFKAGDEDIHMAIERRLTELTGEAGAKIHTGRSRNDQVVTDLRLYLKRQTVELQNEICRLVAALLRQAEQNLEVILPGYTHTQQAQPVRLPHYLFSAIAALRRHHQQLTDYGARIDELPLGCGALAGTAFLVDREILARELGFARVMQNSIDATGSRSFCSELAFICADLGTTLSRYCHDFILWCSLEYGFIDPGEQFATGSSMMPNKKNPDAFELVRGKAAQLIGILSSLLTLQKGIPVTYSRDLQDDKKPLFEALQIASDCLQVFTGALATCHFRERRMRDTIDSSLFATDLADYLVRKGVPFRHAHHLVGSAVQHAERIAYRLHELPLSFWLALHPAFDQDVQACFAARASVERRQAAGGTAKKQIQLQLNAIKKWLQQQSKSKKPSRMRRKS